MSLLNKNLTYSDSLHLKELSELYYPNKEQPTETSRDCIKSFQVNSPSSSEKKIKPVPELYKCCKIKTTSYKKSVDHWIQVHHIPNIKSSCSNTTTQHGILPQVKQDFSKQCKSLKDLGNTRFTLLERSRFFLYSINHIPSNCNLFRPCRNKNPRSIENPFSAALSLAYDFIDTVNNQPPEYCYFLSRLLNLPLKFHFPGTLRDHLPYWLFWFQYCFPPPPKKQSPPYKMILHSQILTLDSFETVTKVKLNSVNCFSFKLDSNPRKRPRTKTHRISFHND